MDKTRRELVTRLKNVQTAYSWINRQNQEAANTIQSMQAEIDALNAQVEELILQAGDMEKLAIEHMLERDAALIQVDELKAQVEELNEKLMLAEIRAERADIDHARQLAYWKIIVKHNLCEEVDKSIQQQKGDDV